MNQGVLRRPGRSGEVPFPAQLGRASDQNGNWLSLVVGPGQLVQGVVSAANTHAQGLAAIQSSGRFTRDRRPELRYDDDQDRDEGWRQPSALRNAS
jgi:hypothetical protein